MMRLPNEASTHSVVAFSSFEGDDGGRCHDCELMQRWASSSADVLLVTSFPALSRSGSESVYGPPYHARTLVRLWPIRRKVVP